MTRKIKCNYAQTIGSKCIQVISPTRRTSGKAMQHDQRWATGMPHNELGAYCRSPAWGAGIPIDRGISALFDAEPYAVHLHKRTPHVQVLVPPPCSLSALPTTSQSRRCI